ncbi:hypothetical protein HBI88_052460 [Parastagonospora nodorum]|nr:hypothetical protein HBH74_090520 [Parastagonospora nodorum]KAH4946652.1 hypothetical protein HBH73_137680 [Parastagonospora nodorum]KAH5775357.1 hypothetical protein HBI97_136500 [Parastagonospora nodorum]KAH5800231.1 hypothetical protein HBI94_220170 [Parastagonospora nodorum]KAH5803287.1 hypothetical protein HBI96_130110 [Parastagonospora nodorum]
MVAFKSFASGCKRLAGVRKRETMIADTQPSPGIVVNEAITMRPAAGLKRRYDDQGEQGLHQMVLTVGAQLSFVTQNIDGVRYLPECFGIARFHLNSIRREGDLDYARIETGIVIVFTAQ